MNVKNLFMKRCEKTIGIFLIICLLLPFCSYAAKISLCVSNKTGKQPVTLSLPDGKEFIMNIDASGKGELTVDITEPVYAELSCYYTKRTLFLAPDTDIRIAFEEKDFGKRVLITGTGSPVNTYLNSGCLKATGINDTGLSEKAFLLKTDSMLNANLQALKNAGLPEDFNRMETERLNYFTYATLPDYPYFHVRIAKDSAYEASSKYWNKLRELMVMDASLLRYEAYRSFLAEATGRIAKKQYPELRRLEAVIRYVESDVTEPRIAEFLINRNVYAHIERNGLHEADAYCAAFSRYVKSPVLTEAFETLCNRWRRLEVGALSPDFDCTDLSGKKVTLSDFRGKYVYIDIWATWCGPCQREIPYLQKLEERYQGKDIHFVSISCDTNRNAWENRVKAGLKGVQLHLAAGNTFMDEYMITGIPRFILLDKEGKIISADMSRPSDSGTVAKLNELLY